MKHSRKNSEIENYYPIRKLGADLPTRAREEKARIARKHPEEETPGLKQAAF